MTETDRKKDENLIERIKQLEEEARTRQAVADAARTDPKSTNQPLAGDRGRKVPVRGGEIDPEDDLGD